MFRAVPRGRASYVFPSRSWYSRQATSTESFSWLAVAHALFVVFAVHREAMQKGRRISPLCLGRKNYGRTRPCCPILRTSASCDRKTVSLQFQRELRGGRDQGSPVISPAVLHSDFLV